jgi:hypothetical protein
MNYVNVYMISGDLFTFRQLTDTEIHVLREWFENKDGKEPEVITMFENKDRYHLKRQFVMALEVVV